MHRLLATLTLAALILASLTAASPVDAKKPTSPPRPKPTPTASPAPTASPTPTPAPTPTASPNPTAAPTSTPPPTAGTIEGLDVSVYQGTIDWPKVAAAGKRFVFIRASAGSLTRDANYAVNRAGARAAGLPAGAYHYANPDAAANDALNEANWFLSLATPASGDLLPVLDLEVTNGLSVAAMTTWTQTWLTRVTTATGVRPIIYTSPSFWKTSMGDTDWFARNGYRILWVAHWTTSAAPTVPAANWGGNSWTFWQYSSSGSVAGISGNVDLDRYNGSVLPASVFIP